MKAVSCHTLRKSTCITYKRWPKSKKSQDSWLKCANLAFYIDCSKVGRNSRSKTHWESNFWMTSCRKTRTVLRWAWWAFRRTLMAILTAISIYEVEICSGLTMVSTTGTLVAIPTRTSCNRAPSSSSGLRPTSSSIWFSGKMVKKSTWSRQMTAS